LWVGVKVETRLVGVRAVVYRVGKSGYTGRERIKQKDNASGVAKTTKPPRRIRPEG